MRPLTPHERQLRQRIGVRVAQAISFAGITQQELAIALQAKRSQGSRRLTQGYLAQLISGQRPFSPVMLEQVARITKVPLGYLVSGKGWAPPETVIGIERTPKQTVALPLDAPLVTAIRVQGHRAYRLSRQAAKGVAGVLNVELSGKNLVAADAKLLVLVLD